jgi:hypothetical protein
MNLCAEVLKAGTVTALLSRVIYYTFTGTLEKCTASIFRVEVKSRKQQALLSATYFRGLHIKTW